jgi:beta-glucosidase
LVYLNDVAASVTRPSKQLKAYAKVELKPGETQTLNFELPAEAMSFIGVDMKRRIEPGEFKVMVGNQTVSFTVN